MSTHNSPSTLILYCFYLCLSLVFFVNFLSICNINTGIHTISRSRSHNTHPHLQERASLCDEKIDQCGRPSLISFHLLLGVLSSSVPVCTAKHMIFASSDHDFMQRKHPTPTIIILMISPIVTITRFHPSMKHSQTQLALHMISLHCLCGTMDCF